VSKNCLSGLSLVDFLILLFFVIATTTTRRWGTKRSWVLLRDWIKIQSRLKRHLQPFNRTTDGGCYTKQQLRLLFLWLVVIEKGVSPVESHESEINDYWMETTTTTTKI
jgi:hypothetical protein